MRSLGIFLGWLILPRKILAPIYYEQKQSFSNKALTWTFFCVDFLHFHTETSNSLNGKEKREKSD